MPAGLFLLMLAQASSPHVHPPLTDAILEQIATNESRLPSKLHDLILYDPAMRAEIRRVGFEKGCKAMEMSSAEVSGQRRAALVQPTVKAIRAIVPEAILNDMWPRSFFVGRLSAFRVRIDAELDRSAAPILAAAYDEMRDTFLKRTKTYPDTTASGDNVVMPKADIAKALDLNRPFDLDKPAELGLACAELLISPAARPTITTAPFRRPELVLVPPDGTIRKP